MAQIPQGGWGYFAALRIVHDTGKEPVWDQTCFRSVFLSSNSEVASAFFQGSGVLIQCALCLGIVRILDLQEQISYEVCSGARQRALVTIQPTLPTLPTTRCIEGRFRRYHSGQKYHSITFSCHGSAVTFADSIDHLVTDLALGAELGFHKGHILLRLGIELRINCRSGVHYDGVSSAALGATLSVSEHFCQ